MPIKIVTNSTAVSTMDIKPKLKMHFSEMKLELILDYHGALEGLGTFGNVCMALQ